MTTVAPLRTNMPAYTRDRSRDKRIHDLERMCDQIDYDNRKLAQGNSQDQRDLIQDSVRDPSIKRMLAQAESGSAVRGDFGEAIKSYAKSVGMDLED